MSKIKIETEIEFGKVYKDNISGYTGVATAITVFMYGCLRVCLESKKERNEDGSPREFWFDEQRLISKSKAPPGGPQKEPVRRKDYSRKV